MLLSVQPWLVGMWWAMGTGQLLCCLPSPQWRCHTSRDYPLHPDSSVGHRVNLLLKVNSAYVPFLRLSDNVFHNPTPSARGVRSERLQGGRALWLCVSVWIGDYSIMRLHHCAMYVLVQVSGLRHSSYCSLLLECPPNWLAPLEWREWKPQLDSSPLSAESCCELLAAEPCLWLSKPFSLLAFHFCSHLPAFRYFNASVFQAFLCIE